MTLPGETILTGAPDTCCDQRLQFEVLRSAAGYYIGTFCPHCGPYSRESGYFLNEKEANETLARWQAGQYDRARQ